ncbi:hypothetical protein E0Z10_g5513 [Xylaria hypoxylon]|uniref:Uncharacterized protein n=1 Tax=Xylaria hypoxylon TaxID=37992 RepID=A0A4Z0YV02_9PEZI|nr:hypothetical protein E0Z10_g5513 [Xylaria hypoxylon]
MPITAKKGCGALEQWLCKLEQALQNKTSFLQREMSSLRHDLCNVRTELRALAGHLQEAVTRRKLLDVEEPELLTNVDGLQRIEYVHRGLKLPPTLDFRIRTQHPIRYEPVMTQAERLRWKDVRCPIGGCKFEGSVRAKPFSDAFAEVILFGWKKEVYAKDITELSNTISELENDAKGRRDLAQDLTSKISTSAKLHSTYATRLHDCQSDRGIVSSIATLEAKEIPPTLITYLDAGSISGLASALQLKSVILQATLSNSGQAFDHFAEVRMRRIQSLFTEAQKRLQAHRYSQDKLLREAFSKITEFDSQMAQQFKICRTTVSEGPNIAVLQPVDSEAEELLSRDLKRLQDNLQAQIEELEAQMGECTSLERTVSAQSRRVVRHEQKTTAEIEVLAESRKILNQREKPIGMAVELLEAKSSVDAWLSVYAGKNIAKNGY